MCAERAALVRPMAEDLRAAVVQHIEGVHVQISGRRRGRTAADRPHSGPTLRLLTVRTASSVCLILSNLAAQHGRACEVQDVFTGSLIFLSYSNVQANPLYAARFAPFHRAEASPAAASTSATCL